MNAIQTYRIDGEAATGARIRAAINGLPGCAGTRSHLTTLLTRPGRIFGSPTRAVWPRLTLAVASALGADRGAAIVAAAAVECGVASIDIVDDVVDEDWSGDTLGHGRAANAGLLLAWLAMSCLDQFPASLSAARRAQVGQLLSTGCLASCAGQDSDLTLESAPHVTEECAFHLVARKSGSLSAMACQIGAAIATDDDEVIALAGRFGRHLGIVAQLLNDIAGVGASGAKVGSDLIRRKKTLPIVFALQCARQENLPLILEWANAIEPLHRDNEAVVAAIRSLGGLHFTWAVAAYERRVGSARGADVASRSSGGARACGLPPYGRSGSALIADAASALLATVRGQRWWVAAATMVILSGLAAACLTETRRPVRLGLDAAETGNQLVVSRVQPAGWGWDAGIRPGDLVIATDGRIVDRQVLPVTVARAREVEVRSTSGTTITATVASAESVTPVRYRWSFLALATFFALIGAVVFLVAEERRAAWIFFGFATAWATTMLAAIAIPVGRGWSLGLEYGAVVASGTTTLLLALIFPEDRLVTRGGRAAALVAILIALGLLAAYGWVLAFDTAFYTVVQPLMFLYLAGMFIAATITLIFAFARIPRRQRGRWRGVGLVLLGAVLGLLPFCLLALLPGALGQGYLAPPDITIMSIIFLPLTLGAALLSRQFLAIARLLRRGLIALVVWIVLLGCFSLLYGVVQRMLTGLDNTLAQALRSPLIGIALTVATFPLLQAQLRQRLEEWLFQDSYDYAATLQRLGAEIAWLADVDQIADHTLATIGTTLDLEWANIALDVGGGSTRSCYTWDRSKPSQLCANELCGEKASGGPVYTESLVIDGVSIGRLSLGPKHHDIELLPEDRALVSTMVPLVAASLQTALLVRRLEHQVAVLGERERELAALSARLLTAQEDERRRIALDIHDDPLQRAILLARNVGGVLDCPHAATWHRSIEEISSSLRAICVDLRPPALDDLGLVVALEQLVEQAQVRADVPARFATVVPPELAETRLPPELEVALFRVAQEAINNCIKHARMDHVWVTFTRGERCVRLEVADDGGGFTGASKKCHRPHLGLLGMRERLRPWQGTVQIDRREGGGTIVIATVQCQVA